MVATQDKILIESLIIEMLLREARQQGFRISPNGEPVKKDATFSDDVREFRAVLDHDREPALVLWSHFDQMRKPYGCINLGIGSGYKVITGYTKSAGPVVAKVNLWLRMLEEQSSKIEEAPILKSGQLTTLLFEALFKPEEINTIQAALTYWRREGVFAADASSDPLLPPNEVAGLSRRFEESKSSEVEPAAEPVKHKRYESGGEMIPSLDYFVGPLSSVEGYYTVFDIDAAAVIEVLGDYVTPPAVPVWEEDGYKIFAYEGDERFNTILCAPDGSIVGFYEGFALWIQEAHRGRYLGARLVCETAKVRGGSAVDGEEMIGFTEGGWLAHVRGYDLYLRDCAPDSAPEPVKMHP